MDRIHWKFAEKFRSQWVKVKFYRECPDFGKNTRLKNVRFCEAVNRAVRRPVLLDQQSISCPGARYAFGWGGPKGIFEPCQGCFGIPPSADRNFDFSNLPRFNEGFECIGLNIEGDPDMLLSYVSTETAKVLARQYHCYEGKALRTVLSGVMPICSGVAVKAFLDEEPAVSFGCINAPKVLGGGGNLVAVGIPQKKFGVFLNKF